MNLRGRIIQMRIVSAKNRGCVVMNFASLERSLVRRRPRLQHAGRVRTERLKAYFGDVDHVGKTRRG